MTIILKNTNNWKLMVIWTWIDDVGEWESYSWLVWNYGTVGSVAQHVGEELLVVVVTLYYRIV